MKNHAISIRIFSLSILIWSLGSCDDFVEVDAPRTELISKTVFSDGNTAEAAMADVYNTLRINGFASGSGTSISLLASLSADEQQYYSPNSATTYLQFNNNELHPDNSLIASLWSGLYTVVFKTNAIISGLEASTTVTSEVSDRLISEAKFIRAFCYFYLVNMWGDVPLVLGTDYMVNNSTPRTGQEQVYRQIIDDCQSAASVLPEDYSLSDNLRVRANKWAAVALLARVHLYTQNWAEAESAASQIIDQVDLFELETDLASVFRGEGKEAILQWWSQRYPNDRSTFTVFSFGPLYGAMREEYISSYETDDQRWTVWGRTIMVGNVKYYYYLKYYDFSNPPLDYTTIFRLAEQYLIRAEAKMRQGKLTEAAADINIIRDRAGLPSTTSTSSDELFNDIIRERKAEFATEWGHRWFDLKRWGIADDVLGPIKSGWSHTDILYPIPQVQIVNNPNTSQNPG